MTTLPSPDDTAQNLRQPPLPSRLRHVPPDVKCIHRIKRGPPAGHAVDLNAEHNPRALFVSVERNRGGLPPDRMHLKEALGDTSRVLIIGGVWEFLVTPENDDAHPLPVSDEFVHFETDEGILSHPFDLLTECGVAIEELSLEIDMYGNDVGLVVPGARQTSGIRPGEQCTAFLLRHLQNYHL